MTVVTTTRILGNIRIYLNSCDTVATKGFWNRLLSRPIYREIVNAAKRERLTSAGAITSQYGYCNREQIQGYQLENANNQLAVCIDIIDESDRLLAFCRKYNALLRGRMIVYTQVETWTTGDESATDSDSSRKQ